MSATSPQSWMLPAVVEFSPLSGVDLPLSLRTLLRRRGFGEKAVEEIMTPPPLPDPSHHFPDLAAAVARVCQACERGDALAVCGDYDADGMTSTALLLRAFRCLGARPKAAIPSRMDDGYGLNPGMVEQLHAEGIRLLITVDNGVAAKEALERAEDLEVDVILTDHHTLPDQQPKAMALIHPATTPENSPYRSLAGVGLAYIVARTLALEMDRPEAIANSRDLFCIGTVADMAPLTGANRSLLKEGLRHLHRSSCPGVQALQQLHGHETGARSTPVDGVSLLLHGLPSPYWGQDQVVTGLLTGRDLIDGLQGRDLGEELLLPSVMLRQGQPVFLDDMDLDTLRAALPVPVRVVEGAADIVASVLGPSGESS